MQKRAGRGKAARASGMSRGPTMVTNSLFQSKQLIFLSFLFVFFSRPGFNFLGVENYLTWFLRSLASMSRCFGKLY